MDGANLTGRSLGDFDLLEVIGSGAFGTVFRARQRSLDRIVAVKVLHRAIAGDQGSRSRFAREGRASARLEHPNIVPVYAAGEQDGVAYLAMRFIEGESLEERLADGPVSPDEAVRIISAVASALTRSHSHGIIHRDVKPANILLEEDRVYLTDFGIAVVADQAGKYTIGGIGTADYVSPEQAEGHQIGPPADLYSLACTAHHCLVGTPPFERPTFLAVLLAHVSAPPPAFADPALSAFFAKAMAKSPLDRFTDGSTFAAAFAAAVSAPTSPTNASAAPLAAGFTGPTPNR